MGAGIETWNERQRSGRGAGSVRGQRPDPGAGTGRLNGAGGDLVKP